LAALPVRRACIDIGSNTTRLLVADCDGPRLTEIHQERSFTRIGASLRHDGQIAPEKVDEVVDVVVAQLASAHHMGAVEVRCVATASVRRASNGSELAARIAAACPGLRVEVLSGEDEARLAFVGAARTLAHAPQGPLGVVDVGGGSSELVVGTPPDEILWWESFPLGSGDLADACLPSDPPTAGELTAAREQVAGILAHVGPPHASAVVAVGGSATSLMRLVGPVLDAQALGRSLELLCAAPARIVARRYALDPDRARLMPAGLVILEAVAGLFEAPLQVGRGGIREGVLLDVAS
jgi:exopolyphosphatase / guanosine-5'-triphosphate,3'-diphosphate pyrophosphatase